MWGYSGGTIPTSFAAEIKQSYASELNFVGTASGGVAPADFAAAVQHNNNGLYAGTVSAAIVGIATEYPDMQAVLAQHVDPLGQFILASKKVLCHPYGTMLFPGLNYLGTFQGADPLSIPAIQHAIADNALGQHVPSVPDYLYHAQFDELIPIAGTDRVVDWYCRNNAPSVTYVRELAAEHISALITGMPAFHWIKDRLNGVPAPSGCSISSPVSEIPNPQVIQAISELLPPMAQALVGMAVGTGR